MARIRAARALSWAAALLWLGAPPAAAQAPLLDIVGMTFITSRSDANELVLHSETAQYDTRRQVAHLRHVRAEVSASDDLEGFEMECERGTLHLGSGDFRFRGDVRGRTEDGRHFTAQWVRYQPDEGLLFTDDPVQITEESGISYKGGGFRYYVKERRFKLLGGAQLVQEEP